MIGIGQNPKSFFYMDEFGQWPTILSQSFHSFYDTFSH